MMAPAGATVPTMDAYPDKELPTRPDGVVPARPCKHCHQPYGSHAQTIQPQNDLPCHGTRQGFERDTEGDHVR